MNAPGLKVTRVQVTNDSELAASQQSPFRAIAARGNYPAADKPEIQFAAKEACRWMSSPKELALVVLSRF